MKKLTRKGIEALLSCFLFGSIMLKSFADEHTEFIDSERNSSFNSISKTASTKATEANATININQDLEYYLEAADVLGKKNNYYASFNDAYGIYLIIKNPEARIIYTVNLGNLKKPERKEKYELFPSDRFATLAASKLISRSENKISWELSPCENGRLVFGRPVRGEGEKNLERYWYFNASGHGTTYTIIGNKDDPTPLDYTFLNQPESDAGVIVNVYGLNYDGGLF